MLPKMDDDTRYKFPDVLIKKIQYKVKYLLLQKYYIPTTYCTSIFRCSEMCTSNSLFNRIKILKKIDLYTLTLILFVYSSIYIKNFIFIPVSFI